MMVSPKHPIKQDSKSLFTHVYNDKDPFNDKHKNYNLSANEGVVIFLTSKLITCFIDGFTLEMKSQSIAYLLNESEHVYWILDFEDEVHSIRVT